jgi:coproporphyrinogen III oxidase-like Fe-S oxidoreductase
MNGVRTATRSAPKIGDYLEAVENTGIGFDTAERLSPREAAEERLMLGLRIREGVTLADIAALDLLTHPKTAELVAAGLIVLTSARMSATSAGRLVLDRVIAELVTS